MVTCHKFPSVVTQSPSRLNDLIALAYRTSIGKKLHDYIEYLNCKNAILLLPSTDIGENPATAWLEDSIINGDYLQFHSEDIIVKLSIDSACDIELASILIHEATHYCNATIASQKAPYELNLAETEIQAFANTYLYFTDAITIGDYTLDAFNTLNQSFRSAIETCWLYTVGSATRKQAVETLLNLGEPYTKRFLGTNISFLNTIVPIVKTEFSDCLNSDVTAENPSLTVGTADIRKYDDIFSVQVTIHAGMPNTAYQFFLKCICYLGTIDTNINGIGSNLFTFNTTMVSDQFAFEMCPDAPPETPLDNTYQSLTVKEVKKGIFCYTT